MRTDKEKLKLEIGEGGCSAKFPQDKLHEIMKFLPISDFENLLVGKDNFDDAAVWKINENQAVVQTVDFFPALCEEPYYFGQIAAANAISDIYAMGAKPLFALNIVLFPADNSQKEVLQEILRGGADKLNEANIALAGGHTIKDDTTKYGLTVTGICECGKILKNSNAKSGEKIILTKALGTGVALAGRKLGELNDRNYLEAVNSMVQLNNIAEVLHKYEVKCATDITGFGLIGHSLEVAGASGVSLKIDTEKIPVLNGVSELLEIGCFPCALFNNLHSFEKKIFCRESLNYNLKMLCFDAQTSGGILFTCKEKYVNDILTELHKKNFLHASLIGEVVDKSDAYRIILK